MGFTLLSFIKKNLVIIFQKKDLYKLKYVYFNRGDSLMVNIIKKNHKKQKFSPVKIKNSIIKAAREAKVSASKKAELVKKVALPVIEWAMTKTKVKSQDIRRHILLKLSKISKSTAAVWKKYDKKKK